MLSFYYTILLWCIDYWFLMYNSNRLKKVTARWINEFGSIICPQMFRCSMEMILNIFDEFRQYSMNLIFSMDKKSPCGSWTIINNCDKEFFTIECWYFIWTPQIDMKKFKRMFCMRKTVWKRKFVHFWHSTWLTMKLTPSKIIALR